MAGVPVPCDASAASKPALTTTCIRANAYYSNTYTLLKSQHTHTGTLGYTGAYAHALDSVYTGTKGTAAVAVGMEMEMERRTQSGEKERERQREKERQRE